MDYNRYLNYVPLPKIVSAAMIDSYSLDGTKEEMFYHWAGRGMKKLYRENVPRIVERMIIPVNRNTLTATLPPGVGKIIFIGTIKNGYRVPLHGDADIINESSVKKISADSCPRCGRDKSICNLMKVEETVEDSDTGYESRIFKYMKPNGDYILETTTPYLNTENNEIEYRTTRRLIYKFDTDICGCLKDTEENNEGLKKHCYAAYACQCKIREGNFSAGNYKLLEESGLIQLSPRSYYKELYIEYYGLFPKVNGSYVVPEVCFEALVEWIKYKAISDKPNTPAIQKQLKFQDYKRERNNMEKILFHIPLSQLVHALRGIPQLSLEPRIERLFENDYSHREPKPIPKADISTVVKSLEKPPSSNGSGGNTDDTIDKVTYTNSNGSYLIKAGYILEKIVIVPDSQIHIGIGYSAEDGAVDIDFDVPAGMVYTVNIYANTPKAITFSGMTAKTTIYFILNKLT